MSGKVVCITGSTDGIGRAAALQLAGEGVGLILHGRDGGRLDALLQEIGRVPGSAPATTLEADFRSLDDVGAMAETLLATQPAIDALVNNAGVYMPRRETTGDGFETTFAVNYLAHVHLTLLLEPLLAANRARIVNVSSVDHHSAGFDRENMQGEKHYSGYNAYAFSKLCTIMFTLSHAETLDGTGTSANALDPGILSTKLLHAGWPLRGEDPAEGGAALCAIAISPEFSGVNGRYFEDGRPASCSALALDPLLRQELWESTMEMLNGRKG